MRFYACINSKPKEKGCRIFNACRRSITALSVHKQWCPLKDEPSLASLVGVLPRQELEALCKMAVISQQTKLGLLSSRLSGKLQKVNGHKIQTR